MVKKVLRSTEKLSELLPLSPSPLYPSPKVRGSFCESGEGVRLSRERGWPPGKSGKLPGKSGELPGKSGKLPGNLCIAGKFHSERTSGEVAGKLPGRFGELLGKSGDFPEARGSLTSSQRLAKFVPKKNAPLPLHTKRLPNQTLFFFRIIFGNSRSVITEPNCFWNYVVSVSSASRGLPNPLPNCFGNYLR